MSSLSDQSFRDSDVGDELSERSGGLDGGNSPVRSFTRAFAYRIVLPWGQFVVVAGAVAAYTLRRDREWPTPKLWFAIVGTRFPNLIDKPHGHRVRNERNPASGELGAR
jgi:hypothetical protein